MGKASVSPDADKKIVRRQSLPMGVRRKKPMVGGRCRRACASPIAADTGDS